MNDILQSNRFWLQLYTWVTKLAEFKQSVLNNETISQLYQYSTAKEFEFCFIPPRAPHFWGSVVADVNNLAEANLSFEELLAILTEIEAIINSRPITLESADLDDGKAVSPAPFLCQKNTRSSNAENGPVHSLISR